MQNKILKFMLTLVLLICAMVAGYFTLTEEVPIAAYTIPEGTTIVSNYITSTRMWKWKIEDKVITNSNDLIAKTSLYEIVATSPFYEETVGERAGDEIISIDYTNRAIVSIPVSNANIPSDIKVGDSISIISIFDEINGVINEKTGLIYDCNAIVYEVVKNESGVVSKLDLTVDKDKANEVAVGINSSSQLFVIRNVDGIEASGSISISEVVSNAINNGNAEIIPEEVVENIEEE